MEKTNILITSAGRRVSLVKFFKNELNSFDNTSQVFCTDLNPDLSSACQAADDSFKIERVTHKSYIASLLEICRANNVKLIVPTIDTELIILAQHKSLFLENDIIPLVSDLDFIEKCRDKRQIHNFFDVINFNRATEFDKNNINFPVFVKPFDGSRSIGIHLLNSEAELTEEIKNNPKNMFLEYFSPKDYKEYTVDIYFNKNSEIISIVPRERIFVRDGEVNKACARKNSIIPFVLEKFKNVQGLRGCITLQVFKHNVKDQIIGIEINPRFGGGFPLSYLAGANFVKWIIEEYLLKKTKTNFEDSWKDNTLMLRYDSEIITYGYKG